MIRPVCVFCCALLLTGCLPETGKDIDRPADQGFSGNQRPDEPVVMTHRITAVGLKGSFNRAVTVTVEARPDSDPSALGYEVILPADGNAFVRDPGLNGGSAGDTLHVQIVDSAGNLSGETVAVEFNP